MNKRSKRCLLLLAILILIAGLLASCGEPRIVAEDAPHGEESGDTHDAEIEGDDAHEAESDDADEHDEDVEAESDDEGEPDDDAAEEPGADADSD